MSRATPKAQLRRPKPHRLSLDLSPRAVKTLETLRSMLETGSNADAIRAAIYILARLGAEVSGGARLIVRRPGASDVELVLALPWEEGR